MAIQLWGLSSLLLLQVSASSLTGASGHRRADCPLHPSQFSPWRGARFVKLSCSQLTAVLGPGLLRHPLAGQPAAPLPATPASLSHRDPLRKEATAFCPTEGERGHSSGLASGSLVTGPDSICSLPALGWRPLPLVRVAVLPLVGHSCQGTRAVVHSGSHFPPGHTQDSSLLGGSPGPGPRGRTLSLSIHRDIGPRVQVPRFC